MGTWINNNSALLIGTLFVAMVAMMAWDFRRTPKRLAVMSLIVVVLVAGYWDARIGLSDVGTLAEVDAALASGTPIILELYSDT